MRSVCNKEEDTNEECEQQGPKGRRVNSGEVCGVRIDVSVSR